MQSSRRAGFTLIELLVVIAIIAILIAMLIPAVQKVRESSAKLQCMNNLKQIGIAMHAYYGRTKVFPPGYSDANMNPSADASFDKGPGWGWAAYLMNDLDQGGVHSRINFNQSMGSTNVAQSVVPVFLCPADQPLPTYTVYNTSVVVASGNYLAVNGTMETSFYPGNNNGAFLRNSRFTQANISDGLSTTLFVGERCSRHSKSTWAGAVPGGLLLADRSPNPIGNAEYAPGYILAHGNATHLPNDPSLWDADVFYSNHPAGVNFLFGDGSVRTIPSTVNGVIYEAMCGREDNIAVGDF